MRGFLLWPRGHVWYLLQATWHIATSVQGLLVDDAELVVDHEHARPVPVRAAPFTAEASSAKIREA
jgi:hypothetical protein